MYVVQSLNSPKADRVQKGDRSGVTEMAMGGAGVLLHPDGKVEPLLFVSRIEEVLALGADPRAIEPSSHPQSSTLSNPPMKINQDLPAEEARIELIPLIDVIFCILTFFILAALQLTRQPVIDVSLPQASTGAPQVRDMWIVRVDSFGRIFLYIEQAPVLVKLSEIAGVLQRYPRLANMIVLYADKDARYNDVLQVLDKLREVGGSRVALATNPTTNESQTTPDATNPLTPGTIPGNGNFNPALSNPLTPGTLPGNGNFNPNPSNPVTPGNIPGNGNFNPAPSNPVTPGNIPGNGNFNPAPANPVTPGSLPGDGNFNPAPANPVTPGSRPGDGNFNPAPANPVPIPVPAPNPATSN